MPNDSSFYQPLYYKMKQNEKKKEKKEKRGENFHEAGSFHSPKNEESLAIR